MMRQSVANEAMRRNSASSSQLGLAYCGLKPHHSFFERPALSAPFLVPEFHLSRQKKIISVLFIYFLWPSRAAKKEKKVSPNWSRDAPLSHLCKNRPYATLSVTNPTITKML